MSRTVICRSPLEVREMLRRYGKEWIVGRNKLDILYGAMSLTRYRGYLLRYEEGEESRLAYIVVSLQRTREEKTLNVSHIDTFMVEPIEGKDAFLVGGLDISP